MMRGESTRQPMCKNRTNLPVVVGRPMTFEKKGVQVPAVGRVYIAQRYNTSGMEVHPFVLAVQYGFVVRITGAEYRTYIPAYASV